MRLPLRAAFIAAACVALLTGLLAIFHYIPDDAYIGFRYARNVARGEGFVFNAGERVEGYTNFLWLTILAAAERLGLPLVGTARVLGLCLAFGTIAVAARAAAACAVRHAAADGNGPGPAACAGRHAVADGNGPGPAACAGRHAVADKNGPGPAVHPAKHPPAGRDGFTAAAAAALITAASTPLAVWAYSGTEIPLFTFLLTTALMLLVTDRPPAAVFTVLALLFLTRPDGAVFYPAAAVLLIRRGRRPRDVATAGLLVAAALIAPYLAWKQAWFGGIIPNTFHAKSGPPGLILSNGLAYTARFAAWHIWLPAAALLAQRARAGRGAPSAALTFTAVHWAAVIAMGGDWMPLYRLLVPTIPALAIAVAQAIAATAGSYETRLSPAPAAIGDTLRPTSGSGAHRRRPAAAGLTLACILLVAAPGWVARENLRHERAAVRVFASLGRALKDILEPGTSIACGSTGAIGYYSDLPVVDILGLSEPEIARRGTIVSRQPGHLKSLGRHVLDRRPDLLLLGNIQVHRGRRGEDLARIKAQEIDIVLDPRFRTEYEFINIPLGSGFYLSCYRRADAPEPR